MPFFFHIGSRYPLYSNTQWQDCQTLDCHTLQLKIRESNHMLGPGTPMHACLGIVYDIRGHESAFNIDCVTWVIATYSKI